MQQDEDGYDPGHWTEFNAVLPGQDPAVASNRRSCACSFITSMVDKLINVAILKTHGSAGVTLALKNLSHGLVNNVNRSHATADTNVCGDFIPHVVSSVDAIRSKTVLNIVDGTNGLYHSGPYGYSSFVWPHRTMYFATDAVAVDRVCWRAIDARRLEAGLPPIALQGPDPDVAWIYLQTQPEHITKAGQLGLGEWRDDYIRLTQRTLG